jgi:simple sugar transport system ATP-binding protein
MREVLAVADRITVLRRGRVIGTVEAAGIDERAVVAMLMGDAAPQADVPAATRTFGRAVLELRSLRCHDAGQELDLDLTVRAGELVGIAGVAGNGQGLLCEAVSGLRPVSSGSVSVGGKDVTGTTVAGRIRAGLAIIPEDRLREGVMPGAPLYESYHLGLQNLPSGRRWSRARLRESARRVIEDYSVVAPSEDCPTANLSGGNIQKILVARAMAITSGSEGGAIVAMNPTRGLDIGATGFVHRQMSSLCEAGHAVVLVSEDLDELMKLCDRIVVLRSGSIVAEFHRGDFDRHAIGAQMVGASDG